MATPVNPPLGCRPLGPSDSPRPASSPQDSHSPLLDGQQVPVERHVPPPGDELGDGPDQDQPLAQRDVQPHNPAQNPIGKEIKELLDEQWAVDKLADARSCLDDPELAEEYGLKITVILPGTNGREVSVAPPEPGMSAADLQRYIEAAKEGLKKMGSQFSDHNPAYYGEKIDQFRARYEEESKNNEDAQDWDSFFANLKKSQSREFSCDLEGGAVVKFASKKPPTGLNNPFGRR